MLPYSETLSSVSQFFKKCHLLEIVSILKIFISDFSNVFDDLSGLPPPLASGQENFRLQILYPTCCVDNKWNKFTDRDRIKKPFSCIGMTSVGALFKKGPFYSVYKDLIKMAITAKEKFEQFLLELIFFRVKEKGPHGSELHACNNF